MSYNLPSAPRTVIILSAALAGASLFLTACSSSRHAPEELYFLVGSNTKLPYWQEAAKGLDAGAANMGVQAQFVGPEAYNPKEQLEAFRRAVSKKPTGIMISASDKTLLNDDINSALAAGIPVITMDSDAPASHRLFFIGTNNYHAGVMGGRLLVEKLGRKGNVVVFTIPAQENLTERLKGYQDAIANTDIKIVQTIDDRGDPTVAFDKTTEMMEKKEKVDAFVCMDSTAGSEVAEALSRKEIKGKIIIAMDSNEGTLGWIEKGMIAATIGQKPYTMAFYGLHLLDDLYHHKPKTLDGNWAQNLEAPIPAAVDTGSTMIDQSNLSLIRKPSSGSK
ncbi:MAG TPA: substrate-binding domain-containing protein [Bryobacteraceae bacterium]